MSYLTQSEIASSAAMFERVAQCATEQSVGEPDRWTSENRRAWAAAPGWAGAWEYAKLTHPEVDPPDPTVPPYNPATDETVITDAMILAQVQAMTAPPPVEPPPEEPPP